ncbi:efflux RND transporter permease subunit [Chelativorans sp. M5D2P16]|uniref:efflux RND transporter permease subunit n=1 Tax=Chelativorans sp. M5D2P16 TaxID=3095678 RepID=UPI002ACAFE60|nr:efflux RND transporter permease subunit [Chelativorans sp. M5D2P16]MDZ5696649.1 efflux RND transporter permease subunit [Chelativorans sp. M5D2P16]
MTLPDLSLRRPVFATVVNLLIVLIGAVALTQLPVRELPQVDTAEVTINIDYVGAAPDVVDAQVTSVVEGAVAGIAGLQSMYSESERGSMRTVLVFDPSRDIDAVANDVRTAVDRVADDLPEEATAPEVEKNDDEGDPVVRLSLTNPAMTPLELSDYADRYIVDRLARLPGVANASIFGERAPAMRIWLEPRRMAALGVTTSDIVGALQANNIELPAGEIETPSRQLQLLARTRFTTVGEFEQIVIRSDGSRPLRLSDVARVEQGPEQTESSFRSDGRPALGIGIQPQAQANTVDISHRVHAELEVMRSQLPEGMTIEVTTDEAVFIESSIRQVLHVFGEAVLLVTAVIFLFLGSARLSLIPVVTIPISILGAAVALWMLGFSVNILTLFALILAIGLVVDDAIVVLENIQRHRAMGMSRAEAARRGANQVNFAVVAATAVLVAVFLPVSFMEGEVGQLFGEFGIALAVAVAISGLVALTLSPVLATRLLPPEEKPGRLARVVGAVINRIENGYRASLSLVLARPVPILALAAFAIAAAFAIWRELPQELTPDEDRGQFRIYVTAPQGANLAYTDAAVRQIEAMLEPLRMEGVVSNITTIVGMWGELRRAMIFVNLVPWDERRASVNDLISELRPQLDQIAAAATAIRSSGGLGIGGGRGGLQFMLGGPDIERAAAWSEALMTGLEGYPGLSGLQASYAANQPGATLSVDRARAQDLGFDAQTVTQTLQALYASRSVGEYASNGRQYPVVLQAAPEDRDNPEDILSILVRNTRGDLIPLSSFSSIAPMATAPAITRSDRVHSVELEADLVEGTVLAEAMAQVEAEVAALPAGAILAWDGQAADYLRASGGVTMVFGLALAIVFLVLAAQFESFRTPLVIMLTVPLGLAGAVLSLWLAGQSINIYSQVGLVLLVGLMVKNGILMVEFANQLRERGRNLREASLDGAVTRLRPIIMTTIATVFGALPLAMATGAGAESRMAIGLVIVGGLSFAFILTLFITPLAYFLIEGIGAPQRHNEATPVPAE